MDIDRMGIDDLRLGYGPIPMFLGRFSIWVDDPFNGKFNRPRIKFLTIVEPYPLSQFELPCIFIDELSACCQGMNQLSFRVPVNQVLANLSGDIPCFNVVMHMRIECRWLR